jgi:hypothetical protein
LQKNIEEKELRLVNLSSQVRKILNLLSIFCLPETNNFAFQITDLEEKITEEEIGLKQLQDEQLADEKQEQILHDDDTALETLEIDAADELETVENEIMIVNGLLIAAKAAAMLANLVTMGNAAVVTAAIIPVLEAR